ncbi:MAG: hypothetical protein AB4060_06055 [Crocosphaera sp.]
MKVYWRKLLVQASLWMTSKILLNFLGLDNIADYSEFLLKQKATIFMSQAIPNFVIFQL